MPVEHPQRWPLPRRIATTAVVAIACYALLWLGYAQHWAWIVAFDSALLDPLHDYGAKHPAWVRFWDVLCTALPAALRLLGLVAVVVGVLRRNLRVVLFVVVAMAVGGLVLQLAKNLADRRRPAGAMVDAASTSFPSGHAMGAMVAVLVLLAVSAGLLGRPGRALSVAVGVVVVVVVGVGRVVLNVHHPSDVVAGWALGYLWYLVCLLVFRPLPLALAVAPDAEPIGEAADETPQAHGTQR